MSEHVYKMIEVVGTSKTGTDDAIQKAVSKAAESLRNLDWYEVIESRGHLVDGKIIHYQVRLRIGFRLD